jgi:transposase
LDLRLRVIATWQSGDHGSWEELAATFRIGCATVNRLIRRLRETGSVEPAPHGGGLEPLIPEESLMAVWELVQARPDGAVDEFADEYAKLAGVRVSRATMGGALARLSRPARREMCSCAT